MEKKEPRNKKKAGKPFWGCLNYSSMGCRGKLELDEEPAGESTLVAVALALSAKVDRDRKARMRDPIKIGDLADLRPIQIPDRLKPDTRTA